MSVLIADRQTLCAIIPRLEGQRVLIIGDVMLDMYLDGDTDRISPEAPVPVFNIQQERRCLGGAANVAHNILSLGGSPHLVGMCGTGPDGDYLEMLLNNLHIPASLLHNSQRKTIVKTRVMARGQQMIRLDKEDCTPLRPAEQKHLCQMLEDLIPQYDVIILSDYAKGLITPDFCAELRRMCALGSRPMRIIVDPKPCNAACYDDVYLLTPNRKEAAQLAQMPIHTSADILEAGKRIMQRFNCGQLLITLGSDGMALFMRDGSIWNIPTAAQAVFDVTGAGDTVIATIGLALAAGAVLPVACSLANYAAGGAVQQVGVGTVEQHELLHLAKHGVLPEFIPWA